MSEDWSAVAAEAAAAIASVGSPATLQRATTRADNPWDGPLEIAGDVFIVTVLDDNYRVRDASGTLIGRTQRTLTIGATGVVPVKSDRIQVAGVWHGIIEVRALAPGGTALMFELDLGA